MSWKIYYLGTAPNENVVSREAVYKLQALGYDATNLTGSFSVTIGGETYTTKVGVTSGEKPYYLCVNDETNDILVTTVNTSATSTGSFSYMVSAAILSGKNILSGEMGMFTFASTSVNLSYISNTGVLSPGTGYMALQRAYFVPYSSQNANAFVSTLYWGSAPLTPGVVIEVGSDRFVCLSAFLYAKL